MFLFVKLYACCFFLCESGCMLIFVHETCYFWIISSRNSIYPYLNLRETCYTFIFSSWDMCNDFSPRETGFASRTCCMLIFVPQVNFIMIFFFMKLAACWFYFVKHDAGWFSFMKLLHVDYFLKKPNVSCFLALINLIYFYFFFIKRIAQSFFSSWNLYVDFSPRETSFVRETCCVLNLFVEINWS